MGVPMFDKPLYQPELGREKSLGELKKGYLALLGSVGKWANILYYGGSENGESDCPCCTAFKPGCYECPIYLATRSDYCINTPYVKWCAHQREVHGGKSKKVRCDECESLAKDMLDFLLTLTHQWQQNVWEKEKREKLAQQQMDELAKLQQAMQKSQIAELYGMNKQYQPQPYMANPRTCSNLNCPICRDKRYCPTCGKVR